VGSHERELHRMTEIVDEATSILRSENCAVEEIGPLLEETWRLKRSLNPEVSNPRIDEIHDAASLRVHQVESLWARRGRVFLFVVRPQTQQQVRLSLRGLVEVPFEFEFSGSEVIGGPVRSPSLVEGAVRGSGGIQKGPCFEEFGGSTEGKAYSDQWPSWSRKKLSGTSDFKEDWGCRPGQRLHR